MGKYNWITGKDFSIRHIALMDRWLLAMVFSRYNHFDTAKLDNHDVTLATLLKRHPDVAWVVKKRSPESTKAVDFLVDNAIALSSEALRQREVAFMESIETDVVYTEPRIMETACNYITAWNPKRLHELADLTDAVVLDVGAGTGRLTFEAARIAKRVYASEPVDRLREHMRDRIAKEAITNVKVLDGTVACLPFEDNTFDHVLSGHVVGDDFAAEVAELARVTKPGGLIVVCNGDDDIVREQPDESFLRHGFTAYVHENDLGGRVYNYVRKVT